MFELITILILGAVFVIIYKSYKIDNARKKELDNGYIALHKVKLRNDKLYDDYLEWCRNTGQEIPVDKHIFVEDIERKENELNKLIK